MTVNDWIAAITFPAESMINKRVPKTVLVEQPGFGSAANRKLLEGIDSFCWVAALKPNHIGIPCYRDDICEYLEIPIVSLSLRPAAKVQRLIELIHRAIPYPILLIVDHDDEIMISLAHKRFAQNESGAIVLDGDVLATPRISTKINPIDDESTDGFRRSLSISQAPREHLRSFYQGYIDRIEAYQAARITNRFFLFADQEGASERRSALIRYARIERDIADLRTQAKTESRIRRTVELNLAIVKLKGELDDLKAKL